MPAGAALKELRTKYSGAPPLEKPRSVEESSWALFKAYVYQDQTAREAARRAGISLGRLRRILHGVDEQLGHQSPASSGSRSVKLHSPIEELALSVRARNAFHIAGCNTIQDVLELDFSGALPRVGDKTRAEMLAALRASGFRHPSLDARPSSEIGNLSRSLDRMQKRIDMALRAVAKEVKQVQRRLRRTLQEN